MTDIASTAWQPTINNDNQKEISKRQVPEVDIFDAPLRCFVVNEQWSIYVLGAISELANVMAWQDTDNENDHAIQQILKLLSEENCMSVQDICDGVICALEKSAARFLSGQAGNVIGDIVINDDGSIVIDDSDSGGVSDETLQSRNGGTLAVASGFSRVMGDVQLWLYTNGVGVATTKLYLQSKYDVDQTLIEQFVDDLIAYQPTDTGTWYEPTDSDLEERLYCDSPTQATVAAWIIDTTVDPNKAELMLQLNSAINPAQFELWYASGLNTPITEYLSYACYRRQPVTMVMSAAQYTASTNITPSVPQWSFSGDFRVIRITSTGKFLSGVDEKEADILYRVSETGIITYDPADWFLVHQPANNSLMPSVGIPEYNPSGNYQWTTIVNSNVANLLWRSSTVYLPDATGEITLLIEDMGSLP